MTSSWLKIQQICITDASHLLAPAKESVGALEGTDSLLAVDKEEQWGN